jgi:hypothetical protein
MLPADLTESGTCVQGMNLLLLLISVKALGHCMNYTLPDITGRSSILEHTSSLQTVPVHAALRGTAQMFGVYAVARGGMKAEWNPPLKVRGVYARANSFISPACRTPRSARHVER